jgi:HD-GYP domain-containing protein (c-di-GMP phosphodiesterase class II)
MQKKIRKSQLRVGMFVTRLVGSWLEHPFWKKSFLLTDRKQLALIVASPIQEIWIDTDRGLDVEDEELSEGVAVDENLLATSIMTCFGTFDDTASDGPSSLADELVRARRIIRSARGATEAMFEDARLGRAIDGAQCRPIVDEITQSVRRNPGAIVSLARLKTSDDYTFMHSVAVCALMVALARHLGMSEGETRDAGLAGLVHDVGKMRMPPEILNKPGALTEAEFAVIRTHPEEGYALLLEADGVGEAALDVCLRHHEKMNGRGYPFGLAGKDISMFARMGAVCDVYDAVTSNRPYKAGWDPATSIQKMAQWSRDGHFDDRVFQAFVKSIGIYPIGSFVRLSSGHLAVVVDQFADALLQPKVKTLIDPETLAPCEPELIDLRTASVRITGRESIETWNLANIDQHWQAAS